MAINIFDGLISKNEVGLTLGVLTIGGLVSLVLLDYGTVAAGIKQAVALPTELHIFGTATGTTLLGWILGRKSKEPTQD